MMGMSQIKAIWYGSLDFSNEGLRIADMLATMFNTVRITPSAISIYMETSNNY
jgi:hypothetical protein